MKCNQCEHFKILFPPMGKYDSGQAKCGKYDLVVDFFSKQKLNRLTCIKEGDVNNGQIPSNHNNSPCGYSDYQNHAE